MVVTSWEHVIKYSGQAKGMRSDLNPRERQGLNRELCSDLRLNVTQLVLIVRSKISFTRAARPSCQVHQTSHQGFQQIYGCHPIRGIPSNEVQRRRSPSFVIEDLDTVNVDSSNMNHSSYFLVQKSHSS
jgi:hypothetical protein